MTLKDKYPNEYFAHWIGMLAATKCPLTEDGYEEQIDAYLEFEGEEEFDALQAEVKQVLEDEDDLEDFVHIAQYFKLKNFTVEEMKTMIEVILRA